LVRQLGEQREHEHILKKEQLLQARIQKLDTVERVMRVHEHMKHMVAQKVA
jgi:hypothetical protein